MHRITRGFRRRPADATLSVFRVVAFLIALAPTATATGQSMYTAIGGGRADGRIATEIDFAEITSVAIDEEGNLYLAEPYTDRISRVDAKTRVVTRYAGDGARGDDGDGRSARDASLFAPSDVELGRDGEVFIATNDRIRRVDPSTGAITSIYREDHVENLALDREGNFYFARVDLTPYSCSVVRVDVQTGERTIVAGLYCFDSSGDGGPATGANLHFPQDVAIDLEKNLYIAETARIRRVDATTGIITTVAGNGVSGFGGDGGLAAEALIGSFLRIAIDEGGLLISDRDNHRVRRLDLHTGLLTTLAGSGREETAGDGGAALDASFRSVNNTVVASSGDLYIADGNRVRRIDRSSGTVSTVAGGGVVPAETPAIEMQLGFPSGIAGDHLDNLYVADTAPDVVWRYESSSGMVTRFAGTGAQGFSGDGGAATEALLDNPGYLALDQEGNLFISDEGNARIRRVNADDGTIETVITAAGGIDVDSHGNLYVVDPYPPQVLRVDRETGEATKIAGRDFIPGADDGIGGPAMDAYLEGVIDVAVGANDDIYLAQNSFIRRIDSGTGIISTVAGDGSGPDCEPSEECPPAGGEGSAALEAQIYGPWAIAIDQAGDMYFANWHQAWCLGSCPYRHLPWDFRIRKVESSSGIISTIAGTATTSPVWFRNNGFAGDGGTADEALLSEPRDIALVNGDLYIADRFNRRVRVVRACRAPGRPGLLSPLDSAKNEGASVTLSWGRQEHVYGYDLYLDETSPPEHVIALDIRDTSFDLTALRSGKTYYWKIVGRGDPHCDPQLSAESTIWSFSTKSTRRRLVIRR